MTHTYTWDKLVKNAYRLNPKTRGANYPYVPKWEKELILPYVGTKSCLVKLRAYGVTQNSLHNVTLLFHNCDIRRGDQPDLSLWDYFKVEYKNEIYYVKKFNSLTNPLTSRCSCFTGDTRVLMADGTFKSFKELDGKNGFEIISYNERSDNFEIVKAFNCNKKKENAEIIKITLDNGAEIKCTPDHKFLTYDGDWICADKLSIGTSLRALYAKEHNDGKLQRLTETGGIQSINPHKSHEDFYVYVYLDPRFPGNYNYKSCSFSFKPIYVGKGRRNRCNVHTHFNTKTDLFHNTIKSMQKEGINPIILKQHINLDEHVAYRIENELTHEIGLLSEGKGPLLNYKHGGEGGLSGVALLKNQEYMNNHNPMKNKEISQLVRDKNIMNGSFEKLKNNMIKNNPMKNEEIVKKQLKTKLNNYTHEQLSDIAYKACHSMSYEERKILGIVQGERIKEQVALGIHHTQTKEWKQICKETMKKRLSDPIKCAQFKQMISMTSKANWKDPLIREKMLHDKLIKKEMLETNTINTFADIIKQKGFLDLSEYKYIQGMNYSLNTLKSNRFKSLQEKAYNKALHNHKVVNIEKINNEDVYCLTAEYLGNLVVEGNDLTSDILSGVVVSNCKDFFYTWSWYNYHNGHCLYGPPPRPYKRKTTWMKPRNPNHIIGCCKHIYGAWLYLRQQGLTLN